MMIKDNHKDTKKAQSTQNFMNSISDVLHQNTHPIFLATIQNVLTR